MAKKPTSTKKPIAVKQQKPPKIFLATPMYGGQCYGHYAQSVYQFRDVVRERGWDMVFSFMFNESLIQRARNGMTHLFLKSDCTHMLFIDADIQFNPHEVADMIVADKDVICGIYPKKEINWWSVDNAVKGGVPWDKLKAYTGAFVINLLSGEGSITIANNQPFEVAAAGTGCMLIKRQVFEKLKKATKTYTNDITDLSGQLGHEKIYNFFDVPICPESNRLLSEDYAFCHAWRAIKGKIYAAPWVGLTHIGTYQFDGRAIPAP